MVFSWKIWSEFEKSIPIQKILDKDWYPSADPWSIFLNAISTCSHYIYIFIFSRNIDWGFLFLKDLNRIFDKSHRSFINQSWRYNNLNSAISQVKLSRSFFFPWQLYIRSMRLKIQGTHWLISANKITHGGPLSADWSFLMTSSRRSASRCEEQLFVQSDVPRGLNFSVEKIKIFTERNFWLTMIREILFLLLGQQATARKLLVITGTGYININLYRMILTFFLRN